ncbi:hypothetical protein, partial [Parageobacillus thermoglucosidasius]|uniref:hypothetical protein n=1 Tax=Parageobacillus thermoglucosidasius TaxID=1426 RepID=UPI001B7FFD42
MNATLFFYRTVTDTILQDDLFANELSPYNCVKREIEKEPCCFPFGRINSGPKTPNIRRNATMAQ